MIKQTKGFTLLEMMLALGLIATLMLALTQLLSQSATVWSDSNRTIQTIENDEIAINFIRKMLNRARPINWKPTDEGITNKTLVGLPEQLYFVAPLPITGADQLGLYLFSIHTEEVETQKNKAMVVSYWQLDETSLEKTLEGEKRSDVIMSDVDSITFSYFGDKDYSDGLDTPIWQDDWEMVVDFPLAVRMTIKRTPIPQDQTTPVRTSWNNLTFALLQRSLQ